MDLLEQARSEPNQTVSPLEEIDPRVIEVLRGKNLSWRAIASWLSKRGVSASHVAIYRRFGQEKAA